ncbi:MAG TPA: FAD:protein FMN transferase [Candidatus Eisenbacteria bacterium]
MTQYHADRKFTLAGAPRHIRVLITSFNVIVLIALLVGVVNYWDKTGMTPAGVRAWYRGNEGEAVIDDAPMTFEKTFRELLDATHPHLFGQGVLLFILSHIVALTGLSERRKIAIYLLSFGAMLLDAAMPWLIRYVSPGLAPLSIVSLLFLTCMFALQVIVPIREMWFGQRRTVPGAGAAVLLLVALGMTGVHGDTRAADLAESRRLWLVMGTTCEVTLGTADDELARRGFDAAWRELALVDSLMSLYRPSSELCRVNREAAHAPVAVSEPTFTVIDAAQRMAESSDGAFDITVKPLMDLWGFYRKAGHRPDATAIDSTRALTGWQRLVLDRELHTVRFTTPGMALDLGGIAKGYALDRAMAAVMRCGIRDALIDLGGNIIARGSAGHDAPGWPVALRDPACPDSVTSLAWLVNEAISSSGGYEKSVVLDGVTYGHILDVRRGEPVRGVAGTTVVAPGAMQGDALSTTLAVLGSEGLAWLAARYPGVEAVVTLQDGGTGKSFYSAGSQLAPHDVPDESDTNHPSAPEAARRR